MMRYLTAISLLVSGCFSVEGPEPVSAIFIASADGSGETQLFACIEGAIIPFCSTNNTTRVNTSSDGQELQLVFSSGHFEGRLSGDSANKEITFSWEGQDGRTAPSSVVLLPTPFEILEPAEGSIFAPTDEVRVLWEPSGEGTQLFHATSCADGSLSVALLGVFDDIGEFVLPSSVLRGGCSVELTMNRIQEGTLDPALTDSFILAMQSRVVRFQVGSE